MSFQFSVFSQTGGRSYGSLVAANLWLQSPRFRSALESYPCPTNPLKNWKFGNAPAGWPLIFFNRWLSAGSSRCAIKCSARPFPFPPISPKAANVTAGRTSFDSCGSPRVLPRNSAPSAISRAGGSARQATGRRIYQRMQRNLSNASRSHPLALSQTEN